MIIIRHLQVGAGIVTLPKENNPATILPVPLEVNPTAPDTRTKVVLDTPGAIPLDDRLTIREGPGTLTMILDQEKWLVPIDQENCLVPIDQEKWLVPIDQEKCLVPIDQVSLVPIDQEKCLVPIDQEKCLVPIDQENCLVPIDQVSLVPIDRVSLAPIDRVSLVPTTLPADPSILARTILEDRAILVRMIPGPDVPTCILRKNGIPVLKNPIITMREATDPDRIIVKIEGYPLICIPTNKGIRQEGVVKIDP
jgi:hypothetical protein